MGGCFSNNGGSASSKSRTNRLKNDFSLPPKPNHAMPNFDDEKIYPSLDKKESSFKEKASLERTNSEPKKLSPSESNAKLTASSTTESQSLPKPPLLHKTESVKLKTFSKKELEEATQNFEEEFVLGEGAFGIVYKGFLKLDDTKSIHPVAIKRLNPECFNGQEQWLAEILILGKLRHPNLVRLFGYCSEKEDSFLIYEFLSQGSLDYHIYPNGEDEEDEVEGNNVHVSELSWQTRIKIALECAQGLGFLHEHDVIHRDFKASNVLLDDEFNAVVTDFGLSREGPGGSRTHVSTAVMGTLGYLDPRYAESGHLTEKSDVYAFGIILLELISGKKAMFKQKNGKMFPLSAWARQHFSKNQASHLQKMIDPRLQPPFPDKSFQILAILAKHCISYDVQDRPTMEEVVKALKPLV